MELFLRGKEDGGYMDGAREWKARRDSVYKLASTGKLSQVSNWIVAGQRLRGITVLIITKVSLLLFLLRG